MQSEANVHVHTTSINQTAPPPFNPLQVREGGGGERSSALSKIRVPGVSLEQPEIGVSLL